MARVLITGGTGTLGRALTRRLLVLGHQPTVYSRGEFEQLRLREALLHSLDFHLREAVRAGDVRFLIGDVRDRGALTEAMRGADWVVHAAALKQVPAAERFPLEAAKTNIDGTDNALRAAITTRVERFLFISSDKAVRPTTVYGSTKMMAEREVMETAARMGTPAFSVLRYGNVLGSRGSVLAIWRRQVHDGLPLTITDPAMTRFWQTVEQAVDRVITCITTMQGGEVFIPRHPAMRIEEVANAFALVQRRATAYPHTVTGARTVTEKRHEELLQEGESPQVTREDDDWFVLRPNDAPNPRAPFRRYISERPVAWVTPEQMQAWLVELEAQTEEAAA